MIGPVVCRILTTTACNAACAYCYEKGTPAVTMTLETAEQTAAFLAQQAIVANPSRVFLEWFGGEPALNLKAIDTISAALLNAGVSYTSSIVTNGLLMDADITQERLWLWKLKRAQISLDGSGKAHEATKGFACGAYERIMENILCLTKRNVRIRLRLNYPGDTSDISVLIEDLRRRFSKNDHVSAYISPLYDREKEIPREIMLEVLSLNQQLVDAGLASEEGLTKLCERKTRCFMMTESGFTVAPDGRLFNCSHNMTQEQCVGSVWRYDAENPIRQAFLRADLSKECQNCTMLPFCRGGCRIAELKLARMFQCHPYKSVLSELMYKNDARQTR